MGDKLEKVTASGTHPTAYGEVEPLASGFTLSRLVVKPSLAKSVITPFILFVVFLGLYRVASWNYAEGPSEHTHFLYQAQALLEGELELTTRPPHGNDWATWEELTLRDGSVLRGFQYDGNKFRTLDGQIFVLNPADLRGSRRTRHTFVSFPPGPAIVMMPLVAAHGGEISEINDVWITLLFAALNVALMYILLRRLSTGGRSGRSPRENVVLTVLFGLGTATLWCSIRGEVWFTALVMGITFSLLYLRFALDARHPILAGLFLACAFATRTPLLFTAVVFPMFVIFPGGKRISRAQLPGAMRKIALFSIIPLIVGCTLLYMNYVRFENPLEFGHTYLAGGGFQHIREYGLFNYHFLGRNLASMFTLLPRLQPEAPYVLVSKHGMSLFLTTPVLFYLFRPRARKFVQDVLLHRTLWLAVALVVIPHLFYQNTGWIQFGYRFSMDYTPYLIALLALTRFPITWGFRGAIIVAIAVNIFGAITFGRMPQFYTDWFFDP